MRYQNLILAAAVLALACATWLDRPKSVTAQTTYSQPVKVVNAGASQAVPVQPQGTTPVSGTVTVGNSSLPVTVGNDSGHPVPTAAVGSEFTFNGKCTIAANGQYPFCGYGVLPASGIVYETVSCYALGQANDTVYADLQMAGEDVYFPLPHVGVLTYTTDERHPNLDLYSGTQNLRVYSGDGNTVAVFVYRSSAAATQVSCTLNGWKYR